MSVNLFIHKYKNNQLRHGQEQFIWNNSGSIIQILLQIYLELQDPDYFCRNYIKHKDGKLEKLICPLEIYNKVVNIVKERIQNKRRFSEKEDSMRTIISRLDDIEKKLK